MWGFLGVLYRDWLIEPARCSFSFVSLLPSKGPLRLKERWDHILSHIISSWGPHAAFCWVITASTKWRANTRDVRYWRGLGCSNMTEYLGWLLPDCFSQILRGICNMDQFPNLHCISTCGSITLLAQWISWYNEGIKEHLLHLIKWLYSFSIEKMKDQRPGWVFFSFLGGFFSYKGTK